MPLRLLIALQEIPAPESLESPLPGGMARVVRFFMNFPQPLQIAGVVVGVLVAAVVGFIVWRRRARIWTWMRTRPRTVYAWAAGAGVMLAVAGAGAGLLGYNYIQHDNGFCTGCHVMGPAFVRFTESEHSQLECHDCHRQPMTASLRQLYLWVLERPEEIGPHAPVPTQVCAECHIQEDPNETWQLIVATQGHQVHLESDSSALAEVQCVTCHGQEVHRFVPAEQTCASAGCHTAEDTRIELGAMSGAETTFHCLGCHIFTAPALPAAAPGGGGIVPGIGQCGSCHQMQPLVADFSPATDPHDAVCGACHNPHDQTAPASAFETCTSAGCHSNPAALTPFHRGVEHVLQDCAACHDAHGFVVDGGDCRSCHTALS
jgi:hypothetical protein